MSSGATWSASTRFMANLVPRAPTHTRSGHAWPVARGTAADAMWIGNEVEALYTNGPAGGAGATRSLREVLAVTSTLLQRDEITYRVDIQEA